MKIFTKIVLLILNLLVAAITGLYTVVFIQDKGPDRLFGLIPFLLFTFTLFIVWKFLKVKADDLSKNQVFISVLPTLLFVATIYLVLLNVQMNYQHK